ncbi:MAG: RDD family protein [Angelakisella sp.]
MAKKATDVTEQGHLSQRLIAYTFDVVVVFVAIELLCAVLGIKRSELTTTKQLQLDITSNVLFACYSFILPYFIMNGQTLGKKMMGLKIVSLTTEDGKLLPNEMLLREVIGKVFIEKANLWITFVLVSTGLQDALYAVVPGVVSTTLHYIFSVPWLMLVSFSMVMNRRDHCAIHDLLGHTRVVSAKPKIMFE